jgi:uncharacterized phage infection (PIP) family protein YhgE
MSSAPANGLAPCEKDPLLNLAKQLPEAQDREWYAELVSYIHSLQPTDELVKIAQLFGFLTLMGHRLPEVIQNEQNQLREILQNAHAAFQKLVATNAGYHTELNTRLSQLPAEVAAGVKPEAIVKTMSESFRQQILKTGLQETQTLLSAATFDLKTTTKALDEAVTPLTARYNSLADQVEKQARSLDSEGNRLARTADTIQRKNTELLAEVRNLNWIWVVTVNVVFFLVGVFCGITWEQHNVADLIGILQNQVAHFEQTLSRLPQRLRRNRPGNI